MFPYLRVTVPLYLNIQFSLFIIFTLTPINWSGDALLFDCKIKNCIRNQNCSKDGTILTDIAPHPVTSTDKSSVGSTNAILGAAIFPAVKLNGGCTLKSTFTIIRYITSL